MKETVLSLSTKTLDMPDYSIKPPWIKASNKVLKTGRTNQSNYAIYNSSRWRKISKETRIKNPICAKCSKEHSDYKGLVLDHIIPINQKGSVWDGRNHQCLCKHPCHDIKSGKDQKRYKGMYHELSSGRRIPI